MLSGETTVKKNHVDHIFFRPNQMLNVFDFFCVLFFFYFYEKFIVDREFT